MNLRLVSSGDGRALAIRDRLVPLVHARGLVEVQRDALRLISLQTGPWTVYCRTCSDDLAPAEASSPGYRHALERQQTGPVLPYGIKVWHNADKVLCMVWADDGTSEVISFVCGLWEDEALRLK